MNKNEILTALTKIFNKNNILTDEPMKNHTSFKIGGNADFLVLPENIDQISQTIKTFADVPIFVIGNGSNLLISDNGIRGIVIKVGSKLRGIRQSGNTLICQSGALLSEIAHFAQARGLGGFEFAAGIPGTLGGAVVMNAGAYDGEMKDVVIKTKYIDENGDIFETQKHNFGYRSSIFSNTKSIIAESTLLLYPKDKQIIKQRMADLARKRREKQPLEYCSAGSTFKRPDGYYAGKLIEDAGLRGYKIGGAAVSDKHCGFIINENNATFDEVVSLIRYVQSEVYKKFGVQLETEVKICGL